MRTIVFKNNDKLTEIEEIERFKLFDIDNLSKEELQTLQIFRINIKRIIHYLDNPILNDFVNNLKEAQSYDEFMDLLQNVINKIQNKIKERWLIAKLSELKPKITEKLRVILPLVISDTVLTSYFERKLYQCTPEELAILEKFNITNEGAKILYYLDENFPLAAFQNDFYALALNNAQVATAEAYKSKKAHLCFACLNGYPSKCEKVADYRKKNLDDYSFIEEGYQTFNNDELKEFKVTKCKHFTK